MSSTEALADAKSPIQALQVSMEILANLIYLTRRSENDSAKRRHYLKWAAKVIEEMRHNPKVYE